MVGPRSVRNFLPSTNTGAAGASPVPGSEMPILACLDSPGQLTMQPITATLSSSTPGYCVFAAGACRDQRHEGAETHGLKQFLRDLHFLRAVTAGLRRQRNADGVADAA